ncbi:unnamed protein product [Microthlaspi erraticum]|uniref:Uncharacterized protein n=1 Tax=Microthlaspi erraticum TaxID=1685480 RepID=A0A6D2IAG2_9BRAS|nr:unnamed protein product [Microthlaspi erraticum]
MDGPTVPVDPGSVRFPSANFTFDRELGRPYRTMGRKPSTKFSRPRYPMARTKGSETMKKKDPFMQPPRKQIKLGSSNTTLTTFH